MTAQIVEKLEKSLIFYKIVILSFIIVISGAFIIILVAPGGNLITTLRKEVFKEIGIDNIKEDFRSNVEIRFYDTYTTCAMTIIDDDLIRVTPYLFNKRGRSCPTLEFRRNEAGIFGAYLDHFNDLWKKSSSDLKSTR